MKRLVLVDGNALLHRAYHATPPLTTSQGELVNAVYGFTSLILKAIDDLHPDYMAIAWDMKAPTFRHTQYAEYKGTRGPADEALGNQYERVHEVVKAFNIPEFNLTSFEADDLIGALAKLALKKDKTLEVIVLTGDRDIMQLINDRVKVLMPRKTINDVGLYGVEEFKDRFGFEPINLIDYKGLAGDQSDNIPGVPGIGDVSATKLVQKYITLENVYKHLDELPERMQMLLTEGKESAFQSKKLATIETEIPIKLDLKECLMHDFDTQKVKALFETLEFKSLINRIPGLEKADKTNSEDSTKDITKAPSENSPETIKLDQDVVPILEEMSKTGVLIDQDLLNKLGVDLRKRLVDIEAKIYKFVGHEFNLNSPKQLAEVLFDELQLPVFKKTKTGRSTDEETLKELTDAHPAVPFLLEYRQLYKLISTYVEALPKSIESDGRIHSTFNVEGAATGRLSSTNPNLQNIPVKGTTGGEIRRAFIAPKGKVLLGADYSQIELRIMAHLADDPGLKSAFLNDLDIHALTASKIFKVKVEDVTKEQRTVGKTMNFATLYGQGARALSRQLGVDFATAKDYITEYFAQFPKVRDWMAKILDKAYKTGYVETIWGRRRYIPELQAGNKMMQSYGERAAVNHPIQGSQADIIKRAMVDIDKEFKQKKLDCKLILQVHDELDFECDPTCLKEASEIICQRMENAIELSIPIKSELKSGPNWGEMTPLKI
jgi:DNA polymerase I-like protein with 3'-5' exonuclease and polymerase domains